MDKNIEKNQEKINHEDNEIIVKTKWKALEDQEDIKLMASTVSDKNESTDDEG